MKKCKTIHLGQSRLSPFRWVGLRTTQRTPTKEGSVEQDSGQSRCCLCVVQKPGFSHKTKSHIVALCALGCGVVWLCPVGVSTSIRADE